jgi:ubiquinone/menaquinone biosynthesis C-methylase UbiE
MSESRDQQLREEFNQWAAAGRGEEMEEHHSSIARQTIDRMKLAPGDTVLDLGCGAGWASRLMAKKVAPSLVVGVDVSDQMIARAISASADIENLRFFTGSAEELPLDAGSIVKVLSIESFYYYADQHKALRELYRVMAPDGRMFLLINLYRENPYSLRWVEALNVPVQVHSEAEYLIMLTEAGFENAHSERIPDLTPTPEEYSGKWFANSAELREFKRIGALLVTATRP